MFSTWYLFCNTISARDSLLHPWFTTLTNKPLKRENLGDPSQTPTAVYLFTYLLIHYCISAENFVEVTA